VQAKRRVFVVWKAFWRSRRRRLPESSAATVADSADRVNVDRSKLCELPPASANSLPMGVASDKLVHIEDQVQRPQDQSMKLKQILVIFVMVIAGLFFLLFGIDLAIGWPFSRLWMWTDVFVLLSSALILYQAIETWFELKPKKK
jgi:hypothetical protein